MAVDVNARQARIDDGGLVARPWYWDANESTLAGIADSGNVINADGSLTQDTSTGLNMNTALGGVKALTGLGKLFVGYEGLQAQKDAFEFNKKLQTNKFNADATQYNAGIDRYNAINQKLATRRQGLGEVDASYTNKDRITKI